MADNQFTPEEEARIKASVEEAQKKAREAEVQAAIQNQICDAERQQPGKKYY